MARIRSLKPTFFTSEDVCKRQPLARILFEGLWCEADKAGRLVDSPFQLKTRILPHDECNLDALLWELASDAVANPLIRRYTANGKNYIQILAFNEHQRPHPKEPVSTIPAEGAERTRPSNVPPCNQPGCIPSSPVGREGDLGSGDLGSGEGDLRSGKEGVGVPPALPLKPLISGSAHPGTWGKLHGSHVTGFCDWVCLPESVFDDFVRRVVAAGASEPDAKAQVLAWARARREFWIASGQIPGDDIYEFWRHEWKATHGTNRPFGSAPPDLLGGLRGGQR